VNTYWRFLTKSVHDKTPIGVHAKTIMSVHDAIIGVHDGQEYPDEEKRGR